MNLQEEKINSHGSNNKVTNRILRQEISRLKSLLDVSRGKVKDANKIVITNMPTQPFILIVEDLLPFSLKINICIFLVIFHNFSQHMITI